MDFMEIKKAETLVLRGAATAMSLDHNGDVYYVLVLWGGDADGDEVKVTFAIPPMATEQFLTVMKSMEPMRE